MSKRHAVHGKGFLDIVRKVVKFGKDNQALIKTVATAAKMVDAKHDLSGKIKKEIGLGKKKHHRRGGALSLAGSGLGRMDSVNAFRHVKF